MTRFPLGLTLLLLPALLLTGCADNGVSSLADEPNTDIQNTPSAVEDSATTSCPSAANAKEVVTHFSIPVASRNDLDDSSFTLTFTNALGEVVKLVEDDADSTPCIGFDAIFEMVKLWSDVTVEMTETTESALPSDQELQQIADLGNVWLETINRDDLHFSLEADPANIGN